MSKIYSEAGVNIEAGYDLVNQIKKISKNNEKNKAILGSVGGFGALFDLSKTEFGGPILVSATDGVGTKLKLAVMADMHQYIGYDLVAMSVNDILAQGARPLFFLDYFATSKLKVEKASIIIESIAKACEYANCNLIGGETAEMPGIYNDDEYDLAGFCVGAVEKEDIRPKKINIGDELIALSSNGLHSNGFSLIRKIIKDHKIDIFADADFDKTKSFGEAFLQPTFIYTKQILPFIKNKNFLGMAHITGGGFKENVPRILDNDQDVVLDDWEFPALYQWLHEVTKIEKNEMKNIFNCGIGAVLVVAKGTSQFFIDEINKIEINELQDKKITAFPIGHIKGK